MQDTLELIFKYASAILSLCVFLFTASMFVINKIKAKRKRVTAEEKAEELEADLEDEQARNALVENILPSIIAEVEDMPNISGATKKMLATSKVLLRCNEEGINFDFFKDFIDKAIEKLITFSKKVNKRCIDKVNEIIEAPVEEVQIEEKAEDGSIVIRPQESEG